MDSNEKLFKDIKDIDLVSYLSKLGFEPAKRYSGYYMYNSPFRDECTPSFKVDLKANLWVDFGENGPGGKILGGDIITFMRRFHGWSNGDIIRQFKVDQPDVINHPQRKIPPRDTESSKLSVLAEKPLYSYALKNYLLSRGIPTHIAAKFCCEVSYQINDRSFYGIGFKNDLGGYEIRNKNMKSSSSPKRPTIINNGSREVAVFEGFMDFLSYQTMHANTSKAHLNFVVLNSAVFFPKVKEFLEQHEAIRMYFDHDRKGREITTEGLAVKGKNYIDESQFYKGEKMDLNKWHQEHPVKRPIRQLRRGGIK